MTRQRAVGTVLLALGAALAAVKALTFKVYFPTDPLGPAAFPLVGALLMGLGAASIWFDPEMTTPWPDRQVLRRIGLTTLSFLAYGALLSPLGFVVATTLEFAALAVLFGGRPLKGLTAGLVFSVGTFALFVYGLGLPLPLGTILF